MAEQECPFCDVEERVLKSSGSAVAILSNPRKVAGHFLVIPKRHVEKPWQLNSRERRDVFGLVLELQQKVASLFAGGVDVRQNYRPFLQQSRVKVDHLHYHILPRDFKDRIYQRVEKYETALFEDLTEHERKRVAEILGET